ncbi:TonB-dependent receptor [Campylobacter sp. MIT 12-8780]|uniref:TonB-dependent receptor n=1 Tax=unclassified Campylobacter TaxID=2593542 RepID=UPI00115DBCB1|nr:MULTISPECIES: TonB-dependent receptor [unclassified Campylobacter]NDJ27250.1 TonB-dependent receptor [Campylobacter sp. MIT 19-121]TQR40026.1 TonB-dependent receptor [Campylobacter sp. MIT 12-8780]
MKKHLFSFACVIACSGVALADEPLHRLDASVISGSSMISKLDELNRNVYTIDKNSLLDKGFKDTESAFRYMPFVNLSNTGLGSNLDLRGQGNKANTSVQVLINGVYANMLDSSHGVTPLNTLSPSSIEEIELLPGGGAVRYGNGTRGGVVNIITRRRFDDPFLSAGLNFSHNSATFGNNYNADVRYGDKFGDTHVNVGAALINKRGPRSYDKTSGGQGNFGVLYDINPGESIIFDADFFKGSIHTSPNNSFLDNANPSKDDRQRQGNGRLHNEQTRFTTSLGYENEYSEELKFDAKVFYHYNRIDYKDSVTRLNDYAYNSMILSGVTSADQSGSFFDDQKIGFNTNLQYDHGTGKFLAGFESLYQMSKRTMNQRIFWSGSASMNGSITVTRYDHAMRIPFEGNKWTNALYMIEKYDFTDKFSLTGGGRYEFAHYDIDANYHNDMLLSMTMPTPPGTPMNQNIAYSVNGSLTDNLHNFAFELTPSYKYSDTGTIYAKYERGYFSPSPNSMLKRSGRAYQTTDLKKETYDTFELGLKDFFFDTITYSGSVFYTQTRNEFYTIGNAHSPTGVEYGNYDKTRRYGFEVASEQFLGILSLNESFSYVDAKIKGGSKIPNVYTYKATLGASVEVVQDTSVWVQNAFFGKQKVTGQNESLKAYSLSDIGVSTKVGQVSLSAGVRNVFDTFYYDYYNADETDTIAGYGYLVGQGRTFFLEGRYDF